MASTLRSKALSAALLTLVCGCTGSDVTISGNLVGVDGIPITKPADTASVRVGVLSGGGLQVSHVNADGGFQFTGVTLPYDAMVADVSSGWLNVFVGLTSTGPTLTVPQARGPPIYSMNVEGVATVGPGATPSVFGDAFVGGLATGVPLGDISVGSIFQGSFVTTVAWTAPATVTDTLYLVTYSIPRLDAGVPPNGGWLPVVFEGLAVIPGMPLGANQTLTGVQAVVLPIGSGEITGTVVPPPGFEPYFEPFVELYAHTNPGPGIFLSGNKVGLSSAVFALDAPISPNLPLQVQAFGASDAGALYIFRQTVALGDAGIELTFPLPSTLTSPTQGAVAGATYRWTPVSGATLYELQISSSDFSRTLTFYTSQTSLTLPDVTQLGLTPFPAPSPAVASYASPSRVDELVTDAGLGLGLTPPSPSVFTQGDFMMTVSNGIY